VEASEGRFRDKVFAVDLGSGVMKLLSRSCRFKLLRTAPDRSKAMLISYTAGLTKIVLLELDLATLELGVRGRIAGELLGGRYYGPGLNMKPSPDLERIAYATRTRRTHPGRDRSVPFALRALDLSTMRITDLDKDVRSENSSWSSQGVARAPCEWIDNHRILYQHIPLGRGEKAGARSAPVHILKIVDVRTGERSECLRSRLRLSMDGGSLRANPFNGEIIYRNEWLVHVDAAVLRPKDEPFPAATPSETKWRTAIDGASEAADWGYERVSRCISASRKHVAHRGRGIRANMDGVQEPIQVCEGGDDAAWPVAWIEDTRALRQRKSQ